MREQIGAKLKGESTDYIWGVVDAVLKTDFPDIRKRCAIHSDAASIMAIPREKIENQQYMTRLYTQLEENVGATSAVSSAADEEEAKMRARSRRERVTLSRILDQVKRTMEPYRVEVVKVDWWGNYANPPRVLPVASLLKARRVGANKSGIPNRPARSNKVRTQGQGRD